MEQESNQELDAFMSRIRNAGFSQCPICKNEDGFTWANSANVPGLGTAHISGWIPGVTTIPGDAAGKREPFPTPLYMLICDRCSHLMLFSKVHMQYSNPQKTNEK